MVVEDFSTLQVLTTGARKITEAAVKKQMESKHSYLGVNHWLLALVERHAAMAEAMVSGFLAEVIKAKLQEQLRHGEAGSALDEKSVIQEAIRRAQGRERNLANERDLAAIILTASGYSITAPANGMQCDISTKESNHSTGDKMEASPRSSTPMLDQFGCDLTQLARKGKLSPVVGREEETELLIETLCRHSKRNPVLVGPAGVGKTAIVEGVARRIVEGKIPPSLINSRIIALQPSLLVAGAHITGELEKRMKAILSEASQDGTLLFIDEIHTIMGVGGMLGTSDLGSMLKPALARGDIACIAATTDDEYRRFIESDTALERRFQPIRVQELSPEDTLQILQVLKEQLDLENPVNIGDDVLRWLVEFGQQYMRNRYFPDKAVDLLEQCFAHAKAQGKNSVDLSDAREVAQRMVGMPVVTAQRLNLMATELKDRRILTDEETQILTGRLQVTMRGLDMRASRPNAVVMLAGDALENAKGLSETISSTLFGAKDRVIAIDFSRFGAPEDINLLVGAPPGYVGYSDRLPIHTLAQIPWCVLLLERVDACHPRIREVLAQALLDGWIMDGRGKTLYLSDAIVVMTCEVSIQSHRSLGFTQEVNRITVEDLFQIVSEKVGGGVAGQVDLFSFGAANVQGVSPEWLKEHFLKDFTTRYSKQGLQLKWDSSFLDWLSNQKSNQYSEHDWEIWVDRALTPSIIPYLSTLDSSGPTQVTIYMDGDSVTVKPG
jgi:ATP-dependent Clp protease ATP-binding subunit ClpC